MTQTVHKLGTVCGGFFFYLMVSLGVKGLQDENFGVERPFGVRLQLYQLSAIIQRLEQDVSISSR
jgi:hypothetical protein